MRAVLAFLLIFLPALAHAAGDGGYLTSFLESNLSGAGRQVKITGFEGALSSQATMKEMTIADDRGVWLTLKGVTLDWSRAALLSGHVEVTALTADEIDLPRLPQSAPAAATPPSAEAQGFSLPDLPVSVSIGKIAATRVVLGAPVLGQAATVSVAGSLSLGGGEGAADLAIDRTDGKAGKIALKASFANASRQLSLNLKVAEDAGGLLSTLLRLPDAPALDLTVAGAGPLDAFAADIHLATDGQPRLAGKVTLSGTGDATRFTATLGGDIAPLFAADYRAFFGPDIQLTITGAHQPSGQIELSALNLSARQMTLAGKMKIGADGLPEMIDLSGHLAAADGRPVLLPLPGARTRVGSADLSLAFDAAKGDGWTGRLALSGLNRPGLDLGTATLIGSGRITRPQGTTAGMVGGTVQFSATGLAPADAAMARALGSTLTGKTIFWWQQGGPFHLPQFTVAGADYGLSGGANVSGLGAALAVTGHAQVQAADLSRFSDLARRPLGGAAKAQVQGTSQVLAGSFDLTAAIDGTGLKLGQPQTDALLAGHSHIDLSAKRDTTGTTIRSLTVTAASLTASARGVLKTGASDLAAKLDFADLGQLGRGYGGALSVEAHLGQSGGTDRLSVTGSGNGLTLPDPTATKLLAGRTALDFAAHRTAGVVTVDRLTLTNPQVSAKATPASGAAGRLAVAARLTDLGLIVQGFPGPVAADGTIGESATGYTLDLTGRGPGGIDARMSGTIAADFATAKLTASGTSRADLVNPLIAPRSVAGPVRFDLRLDGPPRLASLSGSVRLTGGRIAAPLLGLAADGVDVTADLGGGQVRLTSGMNVGGGQISLSGPVNLAPPFDSDLAIRLSRVGLKDPELFSTIVTGTMSVIGPLAGGARIVGRLSLGQTELRVPSTGASGDAAIPEGLAHKGASPAVRATLARAGMTGTGAQRDTSPPRRPFGLDITIAAPSQVFVRGRGLDAELGGRIALTGTTADIVPTGGFDLRRGRLEILGKRFDLTEGSLRLEGRFIPYVHLAASSVSDGVTATVAIDGDASDPRITFSSVPDLPQEEVLSQLLFGHGLSKISAFQAAQLASAVATLAGKGGEGIVSKLRKGFGLDDLDIVTDQQGNASVKVGKYLSRRLYTDVTVGNDGTTEIDLNLDVTKSVTVRGKAGSDGNTGIGVFYERDY